MKSKKDKTKLRKDAHVIKVDIHKGIAYVHRADGVIELRVEGGEKCKHLFSAYSTGKDGKFYYRCIVGGGCDYKKELSPERVEELRKKGVFE